VLLRKDSDVSKPQSRSSLFAMAGTLGWPLILGAASSVVFFILLKGPLNTPLMMRYFAGHPINICTTVLFFVGMAALCFKLLDVVGQYRTLGAVDLPEPPEGGADVADVVPWLDQLETLPRGLQRTYLWKRLHDVLDAIDRKGSVDGVDAEVKYLSDMDAARQQDSYALVRIVIWAAPMLGFLGTVVGITEALGELDPNLLAEKPQEAIKLLLRGLYVAFDTTAQALLLSMILMFIQFLADRLEINLLSAVDDIVNNEMAGRFQEIGGTGDPHLASIQRSLQTVLHSTGDLVAKQSSLWQESFRTTQNWWQEAMHTTGKTMQASLAGAMQNAVEHHAHTLAKIEERSSDQLTRRWEQWQVALSDGTRALQAQQIELARQGEQLSLALRSVADVVKLEEALNANLGALAGSRNFEETVMSLAAAIHLLNARLGKPDANRLDSHETKAKGRAA
jgi:hypothetical protein